jgi:DUF4097 and DUF4098 domain-containing protein YvlB
MIAWDRDSILVRGRVDRIGGENFYFGGDTAGMKFGLEHPDGPEPTGKSSLVVYLPRGAHVSVKTVSTTIEATGVSGWFYSVSGSMHLSGAASSIEAETMTGSMDLDVTVPWIRARTGDGHLLLRGAPQDADVSTVSGTLDVMATSIQRGQLGSVSGDIHYAASPASNAIMEFSSHSGNVELMLPSNVSGVFSLSSVAGAIENDFTTVRPVGATPRSVRLNFGRGGAPVTVRTFKGSIRLRPQ